MVQTVGTVMAVSSEPHWTNGCSHEQFVVSITYAFGGVIEYYDVYQHFDFNTPLWCIRFGEGTPSWHLPDAVFGSLAEKNPHYRVLLDQVNKALENGMPSIEVPTLDTVL